MQSLTRQLKRGNAIIIFDNVFKRLESVAKRGTQVKLWKSSQKNREMSAEREHIMAAQKPIVGKVGRKKEWSTPTRKTPLVAGNIRKEKVLFA